MSQITTRPWLVCLVALGAAVVSDHTMGQGIALFVAVVCVLQIVVAVLDACRGRD